MQIGTLVQYKNLSTPSLPCGHHIGHKYGMLGIVTGQSLQRLVIECDALGLPKIVVNKESIGVAVYQVHWLDHPPHLEQATYIKARLEVLCK